MDTAPELLPRISQERTKAGPHLGCCIQLRQKYNFLIAMGVFGKKANLHTVCQRMYETTTFWETKTDKRTGTSKDVETVNDATAYGRLDNTCRDGPNCKSLIQEELDFLRQCFAKLFGDNAMGHITDEFLLNGTMFQLLKSLSGAQVDLEWGDIDPILTLEAVALAADFCLTIEIENFTGTRWSKQRGGIRPKPPEIATDVFTTKMEYRLFLDETMAREKPIVLEFFGAGEGRTEDGRPARAQILRHVVRSDDREGPWRVSEERNQPLEMGSEAGQFGFCAISGLGQALDELFPAGYDPFCLSDEDLRSFARHVLEQSMLASPPIIGVRRFQLTMPDEVENRPKNRDGRMGGGRR